MEKLTEALLDTLNKSVRLEYDEVFLGKQKIAYGERDKLLVTLLGNKGEVFEKIPCKDVEEFENTLRSLRATMQLKLLEDNKDKMILVALIIGLLRK